MKDEKVEYKAFTYHFRIEDEKGEPLLDEPIKIRAENLWEALDILNARILVVNAIDDEGNEREHG